jgi:type II secretory pathway pseudopilin PulG
MDGNLATFLVITIAIVGAVVLMVTTSLIRARQHRGPQLQAAEQGLVAVREENDTLRAQVARLEERLHVLERIAVDPAERTAREIELLR